MALPLARTKPPVLSIQREKVSALIGEIRPLLAHHYQEVASDADIPLDPDFSRYMELELRGVIRVFTLRDDHLLVGYMAVLVAHSLQNKGSLQAKVEALYIHPAYRKGFTASSLIRFAHKRLKEEGVERITQASKVNHPIGPVLSRAGYAPDETTWSKRL